MNKTDLIQKIKQPEGITLTPDEQSYLIDLINTKKKYGLVWEEKTEDVEEQLRTHLPVLTEVVERKIIASPGPSQGGEPKKKLQNQQTSLFEPDINEQNSSFSFPLGRSGGAFSSSLSFGEGRGGAPSPNHILIEGDNLHALTALSFTHEGMIDVMYFDPPYNTGNKDFKYNDSYVDKEDSYRHSKWLSFMDKRLRIAKRLLSEKGVIFISIDDNEQSHLKMLCDEIFGEQNFIDNIIWEKVFAPKNDAKYFSASHDFIIVIAKNKLLWNRNLLPRTDEMNARYSNPDNDKRGDWTSGDCSVKTYSANTDYPITTPSGRIVNPPKGYCWRFNKEKFQELVDDERIWFGKKGENVPRFKRFITDVQDGIVPITIWKKEEVGHNQDAKQELNAVLHDIKLVFDTPKPIKLINRILKISTNKEKPFTILDFFAGSGTTLHATMQLNAEDGGNRQCILVTNNENKICEEVTYERNRRVIQGYSNSKGEWVEGLTNNNLRYYKSELVPSMRDEPNKRLLTQHSTDLLCIKEDCYTELTETTAFNPVQCRIFTNEVGKYLIVVYHSRKQIEVYEQLISYIKKLDNLSGPIKLYAFSPEKETLLEDFAEVAEKIDAVPLPEAIYNAYRATFRTLKLDKKPVQTPLDNEAGNEDES
ncbi:MAG: site-specific DNA-methyltransferase [Mariniphaga sp.]